MIATRNFLLTKSSTVVAMPVDWWSMGWREAYRQRAGAWGHKMPLEEYKKMMKALDRMYRAEDREKLIRVHEEEKPRP